MNMKLTSIILDHKVQPRCEIKSSVVDEYAEARQNGAKFPPVVVFSDGKQTWLADGWHRYHAAKKVGATLIAVDVHKGTLRDAILYSVGVNADHGERRTNADKRRAVTAMLKDEEWGAWSDREIARRCAVGHSMVTELRQSICPKSTDGEATRTVSRNGTTYQQDTRNIGKQEELKELIAAPTEVPRVTIAKFNRTNDNIGWASWSWNPVTGCKHDCPYCYAREIGKRFDGHFNPTFHEDRILAPKNTNPITDSPAGTRVFVCSMADLFGTWVPNDWIYKVMQQVTDNPQWTFLFLTKNPHRYESIMFPDNAWIGATVDTQERVSATEKAMERATAIKKFVSCEPLLGPVKFKRPELFDWFLIGAKSEGERKIQPDTKWTADIICQAWGAGKSWWMKDNMRLIQMEPLA